ncbi:MAG: hypothetical protein VB934_16275 [Polyangiaceae bacterium]
MHRAAPASTWKSRGLLVITCVFGLCACGDALPITCARPATPDPIDYREGGTENDVYMSADWDGDLLFFSGGAHYRLFHQLGERPRWWQAYLSFERSGLGEASVALAAGNQVELKAIDHESLTVLNGSCADYWLLVVAGGTASAGP